VRRAKQICSAAGCSAIVTRGRCAKHAALHQRREVARKAEYEARRPARAVPTWHAKWREISRARLAAYPLCESCHLAPSVEVHHKVSVRADPSRGLDPTNVMAVCRPCHARIGGTYGNRR
jgi:5-methylcytosine-specific restriction endonuclease McrA